MEIRVGLPLTGGQLVAEAKRCGMPVLFSANAFTKRNRDTGRVSFRPINTDKFTGLDAALDSAGFVAMAKYNGYEWSVQQYVDMAASNDWTWWAQMDCCCEPEVAKDRAERLFRLAETSRLYGDCNREAQKRGIAAPMPVLQGWYVDDYRRSADLLPVNEWPDLVGLGSVCRRSVNGEDGIIAIVEALDRALPKHVQLHLFGVKGAALEVLGGHERIKSIDSMAWDMAARRKWPTGRTMDKRIGEMHRWRNTQLERISNTSAGMQGRLEFFDDEVRPFVDDNGMESWAELIANGEIDYQSAACHWAREALWSEC